MALESELLRGFAALDLLAQVFCDFQPDGFQGVVTSGGMNIWAGHS